MRRLALGLPTVMQVDISYAILFYKRGIFEFEHSVGHHDYSELKLPPEARPGRIWALVNSNPALLGPTNILRHRSPFFIVDAASPTSDHLGWLEKTSYEKFYMKPWTISEVIQAYMV